MAFKSLIQRLLYQSSPQKNYIYFPLHVPNDISLSLRSRKYYDQFKFIKNLIKYIPKNYKLVVKEHPSFIGRYDFVKLNSLIRENKNRIVLVSPNINSYDLIKKAEIVITINSKSGAEAIILNKPFMSFANSFYENFNGINTFKNLRNLNNKKGKLFKINNNKNLFFLYSLNKFTYKGELFNLSKINIKFFYSFLKTF
jgi:capsule polysaccharide modification protein KpsS